MSKFFSSLRKWASLVDIIFVVWATTVSDYPTFTLRVLVNISSPSLAVLAFWASWRKCLHFSISSSRLNSDKVFFGSDISISVTFDPEIKTLQWPRLDQDILVELVVQSKLQQKDTWKQKSFCCSRPPKPEFEQKTSSRAGTGSEFWGFIGLWVSGSGRAWAF